MTFKLKQNAQVTLLTFLIAFFVASANAEQTQTEATPVQPVKVQNIYTTIAETHLPSLAKQAMQEAEINTKISKENEENLKNIFKLLQIQTTPLQNVEKLQLTYNLFAQYEQAHQNENLTIINANTIKDLDLLNSSANDQNHVFNAINQTQTTMGKVQLQKMLLTPLASIEQLKERQALIKTLINDEQLLNSLSADLEKIAQAEGEFLWFWKAIDSALKHYTDMPKFPEWAIFDGLNNSPTALEAKKAYQCLITPLLFIASSAALWMLTFSLHNRNDRINYGVGAVYYTLFSSLIVYTSAMQIKALNMVQKKAIGFGTLAQSLLSAGQTINNHTVFGKQFPAHHLFSDLTPPAQDLFEILQTDTFKGEPSFFSLQGRAVAAFTAIEKLKDTFTKSLMTLGQLDAYVALAKLYKKHANNMDARYCFAEYVASDKPTVNIKNFWHPQLNPNTVVTNDIELGNEGGPRNTVITGPNAGGKSTTLKAITLAILFAQSFGIAPAEVITLTPFTKINTYMNIADTTGQASLFQAEMRRTQSLINMIKELSPSTFAFVIMDEIFTGTNPKEGAAGAYGVSKKLAGFSNVIGMYATHMKELTQLEVVTNGIVENRKVYVIQNQDGSIVFPYKLEKGITDQAIALNLLANEGFDQDILDSAHEIMLQHKQAQQ